jgi:hypothetical protein
MKLSRDAIQRMVEARGGSGGGGGLSTAAVEAMLAMYATRQWVGANFLNVKEGGTVEKPVTFQDTVDMGSTLAVTGAVTMGSTLAVTGDITMGSKLVATQEWANNTFVMKSWFDQIFQVFNDQTKIAVNGDLPQDKSKMNIQAMFGFWTELYVSALGKSPDGQASLFLSSLGDVSIPNPANGQVLTYDSASGKWVALTPASGTDMATVWANLAASDSSHQIDASHLSTALSGLFTALAMSGNDLSITIGGITKTLTVGYATNAGRLYSTVADNWINGSQSEPPRLVFHMPGIDYSNISMDTSGNLHLCQGPAGTELRTLYCNIPWANITGKPFNWVGQDGQPTWLWGSNDGSNYYV